MVSAGARRRIDLFSAPFAATNRAHLARCDGAIEGFHRFLERGFPVVAMALIEIDAVHAETIEGMMQLLLNLRRRQPMIGVVAYWKEQLGSNEITVSRIAP